MDNMIYQSSCPGFPSSAGGEGHGQLDNLITFELLFFHHRMVMLAGLNIQIHAALLA